MSGRAVGMDGLPDEVKERFSLYTGLEESVTTQLTRLNPRAASFDINHEWRSLPNLVQLLLSEFEIALHSAVIPRA